MIKIKHLPFAIYIFISLVLAACQPGWQIEVTTQGKVTSQITQEEVRFYLEKSEEEIEVVALGQLLYKNGFTLIDRINLSTENEEIASFVWDKVAATASVSEAGVITIGNEDFSPSAIDITPSPLASEIYFSIMDIAPTIAQTLGLPPLPDAIGEVRVSREAEQGVIIVLDGLQCHKLQTMIDAGKLPLLQGIEEIHQGLTVYPPITTSASAALLTGAPPQMNGVYGYGYRSTELTTLFDLAVENGKTVVAVEGASLPFNLRNAESSLSGDRDGNGFSDDNVFANSLEVIESGMPDLLYVHFHEIDDMGHNFGPDSPEYESALIRVDNYLAQIYAALPADTFIAIVADHGMHTTDDGGNHGTLTASDLIIPIIFLDK
jgi:hypothetical protein